MCNIDWFTTILVGIMVLIFLFVIIMLAGGADWLGTRACERLNEQIARPTKYQNGQCFIEIAPGLFIAETDIRYYLEFVEPLE